MTLRVERPGPETTVVRARPRAANVVHRATALADARAAFEADDGAACCADGEGRRGAF